jgi:ribonuclease HII
VGVEDIDRVGILNATFMAMCAVAKQIAAKLYDIGYKDKPIFLIDGNLTPEMPYRCYPVIKGDAKSLSIAAASILSKQSRDRLMAELSMDYPAYSWDRNAGYGTKAHQEAIHHHGITTHHRRSFAPIKKYLSAN